MNQTKGDLYSTQIEKMFTVYITRQNQQINLGSSIELVDIELVRSSVELLGEPGFYESGGYVNSGYDVAGTTKPETNNVYCSTVNSIAAINKPSQTSIVYGIEGTNAILSGPHLNHGWVNIDIPGMTRSDQFIDDDNSNHTSRFVVPTDYGILSSRLQAGTSQSTFKIERVKLQTKLNVQTSFLGTMPEDKRIARFVEDFAAPGSTLRNNDGTIAIWGNAAIAGDEQKIAGNCINCMVLTFKITTRNVL